MTIKEPDDLGEDTEGHSFRGVFTDDGKGADIEDTEGHLRAAIVDSGEEEDTEGHSQAFARSLVPGAEEGTVDRQRSVDSQPSDGEEDTEGHLIRGNKFG